MTQQHAISKEGVTYQELQEMKNKLMALLENNATIYNLVQKYPFGMNWFSGEARDILLRQSRLAQFYLWSFNHGQLLK